MTPEIQPSSIDRRLDAIQAEQRLMRAEWRNQNQLLMEFHRDMMRLITRLDDKIGHLEEHLVTTIKIELGGRMADIETRALSSLSAGQEQRLDASIETKALSELSAELAGALARIDALERKS